MAQVTGAMPVLNFVLCCDFFPRLGPELRREVFHSFDLQCAEQRLMIGDFNLALSTTFGRQRAVKRHYWTPRGYLQTCLEQTANKKCSLPLVYLWHGSPRARKWLGVRLSEKKPRALKLYKHGRVGLLQSKAAGFLVGI